MGEDMGFHPGGRCSTSRGRTVASVKRMPRRTPWLTKATPPAHPRRSNFSIHEEVHCSCGTNIVSITHSTPIDAPGPNLHPPLGWRVFSLAALRVQRQSRGVAPAHPPRRRLPNAQPAGGAALFSCSLVRHFARLYDGVRVGLQIGIVKQNGDPVTPDSVPKTVIIARRIC